MPYSDVGTAAPILAAFEVLNAADFDNLTKISIMQNELFYHTGYTDANTEARFYHMCGVLPDHATFRQKF
jgi:hypothetical protein